MLQLFGCMGRRLSGGRLPLLGGTNVIGGLVPVGNGGLAVDWLNPFVFYGATENGQLLVINAISASLGLGTREGASFPAGTMVIQNYDFGGWQDAAWGRRRAISG